MEHDTHAENQSTGPPARSLNGTCHRLAGIVITIEEKILLAFKKFYCVEVR